MKATVATCKIKHAVQGKVLTRARPRATLNNKTSCVAHLVITINFEPGERLDDHYLKELTQRALDNEMGGVPDGIFNELERMEAALAQERRRFRDLTAHHQNGMALLRQADQSIARAQRDVAEMREGREAACRARDAALVERDEARAEMKKSEDRMNMMLGVHGLEDAENERFAQLEFDDERIDAGREAREEARRLEAEKEEQAERERLARKKRERERAEARKLMGDRTAQRGSMLEFDD